MNESEDDTRAARVEDAQKSTDRCRSESKAHKHTNSNSKEMKQGETAQKQQKQQTSEFLSNGAMIKINSQKSNPCSKT